MAGLADTPDLSGLPVWLQVVITLAIGITGTILVRLGYRKIPDEQAAATDVTASVVGGALADRESMMALAAAHDRLTEALKGLPAGVGTIIAALLEGRDEDRVLRLEADIERIEREFVVFQLSSAKALSDGLERDRRDSVAARHETRNELAAKIGKVESDFLAELRSLRDRVDSLYEPRARGR